MFLNAEAMFSMIDNLMAGTRILIWMVGLGTLFAGAIGVSNIMMVTVKEHTTEIGILRAIGARPKDILQQILSESMVLTTIAGMTGISFGALILQVVENAVNGPGHHKDPLPGFLRTGHRHLLSTHCAGCACRTGTRLPGNGYQTD